MGEHELRHLFAHQDALPLLLDFLLGVPLDAGVFQNALQFLAVVTVDDVEEVFLVQGATLVELRRHVLRNLRSYREFVVHVQNTDLRPMTHFDRPQIRKREEFLLPSEHHPDPLFGDLRKWWQIQLYKCEK